MMHPTLDEIVAGDAATLDHVARCPSCHRLASLAGVEVIREEVERATVVDAAVYTDWVPIPGAQGGMGQIFRVLDRRLARHVAIKQLRDGIADSDRAMFVRRFEREARLTARLQHPAIVGVHEAGRFPSGEPFYAMPLMRGRPLGAEIAARATVADRLGLLANLTTVADAVAYAHDQGIVHRDLKPDNILIGAFGETVVIDWGLAKDITAPDGEADAVPMNDEPVDGLTQFGVGTANYMSPAQARGDIPDPRFDVYALGATLYHLLSGVPPYADRDPREIRRALVDHVAPTPLSKLVPEVPKELADIVAHAMAPEAATRFPSARELAGELRRFQTGQLLASRRYTLGELIRHFARRNRTALRIGAVAALAVIAFGVFAVVRIARERDRAAASEAAAERELRRTRGIVASRSATDPATRLEAIALGIRAVAPDAMLGAAPSHEALQGLVDALTVGPPVVPLRHAGVIKAFALAGDDRLIGVDDARQIVIWNAATGEPIARYASALPQPERPVVSPDRTRVVVCGFDPIGEVIELGRGEHHTFTATAELAGCGFLPDGRVIAASDRVTVRDPTTLVEVEGFPLPGVAAGMAIDPGGRVAVATLAGAVWLWHPGEAPTTIAMAGPLGPAMAFARDGKHLYVTGVDRVVRDLAIDRPTVPAIAILGDARAHVASVATDPIAIALWEGDGARRTHVIAAEGTTLDVVGNLQTAAAGWSVLERTGPLALVDLATGGTVLTLRAHPTQATSLGFGDRLASASHDGAAYLWDLVAPTSGLELGHSGEIVALASAGGRLLSAGHDGTARIWDRGSQVALADVHREISAATWRGDREVLIGDLGGAVTAIDATTGAVRHRLEVGAPVSALVAAGEVVVFGTLAGRLEIRDGALGSPRTLDAHAGAITAIAIAGSRLISSHADGSTRLWDLATGTAIAVRPEAAPVDDPGDHEGDSALVVGSDAIFAVRPDGTTRVLALDDLAVRATLEGRVVWVDGTRIMRALGDGTLDVDAVRLVGHHGAITAVAVAPGLVASASVDGTVRVWDAVTGVPIVTIAIPELGAPTRLAFVAGDLAIGYESGAVRVVPTTATTLLARACGVLARFGRSASVAPYCDR